MGKPKYNDNICATTVYNNTAQNIIQITEDKLRNILNNHHANIQKKWHWTTPLGIFLTILLSLITTNFQDALFLEASVWKAFFILLLLVSFSWLAISFYLSWKSDASLETLMKKIKYENKL